MEKNRETVENAIVVDRSGIAGGMGWKSMRRFIALGSLIVIGLSIPGQSKLGFAAQGEPNGAATQM
ncbi:MAG: hypothetical protein HYR83_15705, partial [Planctomycetes bacterium]|nr:hypothetical protein [Planctomycetota bacterium]